MRGFLRRVGSSSGIFIIIRSSRSTCFNRPPAGLRGPGLFGPFRVCVRVCNLPTRGRVSPAVFMTVACSFVFKIVFKSIKRKLLLLVNKTLVCRFGGTPLTKVVTATNMFSAIFKFVFKDVFKFRSVVRPL